MKSLEWDDDDDGCWQCHGEGGWHDCGEDCCPSLNKEEITHICPECRGSGDLRRPGANDHDG